MTLPETRPLSRPATATEPPRMWNVVLLDDEDHTYEYVVYMTQAVFGFGSEKAYLIARTVDTQGRAVCLTTHKEHAELKLEQILGYGADPRCEDSVGSMSAIIEPAEFDGDDGDDRGGERRG